MREVLAAATRKRALSLAEQQLADHLEEHIEECLSCVSFAESHRQRIRTANGLERLNQQIKRRTKVVRIFAKRKACLADGVTALVAVEQSEEWLTGRR